MNDIEKHLNKMGFVGIDEIYSMGKCHKDNKHYILMTDGLIIYSSIPFYDNVKYFPGEIEECWEIENNEYAKNPFSVEKLKSIMNLVEEKNKGEII